MSRPSAELAAADSEGASRALDQDRLDPSVAVSRWPRLRGMFRVVDRLVVLSDSALPIPGTSFRFGLDPIIGLLLPGAGDAIGGVVSLAVVLLALQYRAPVWVVGRMVVNLAMDAAVGSVPLLGDLFDFGFRANQRNMTLLREHAARATPAAMPKSYWVVAAALVVIAVGLLAVPVVLSLWLASQLFGGQW